MKLNTAAVSHLRSLIQAGHVDRTSAWSFSAADGNALLGPQGDDWAAYGAVHLGIDPAASEKTKAYYAYPVAKGGKVYLSALRAAASRAGQQGAAEIESAAQRLLAMAKGPQTNARGATVALCFALAGDGEVPEWVELIPAPDADGVVQGLDGRKWKMRDAAQVAASFSRNLAIDENHSTHIAAAEGRSSPALGWILELQARGGSVWGRVEWTARGAEALRNKEYRYISPALVVQGGEIVGLRSAGLTNDPNFNLALNAYGADPTDTDEDPVMLKKLLAALGVAEDATEEVALNAVAKLKGDLTTALNARGTPDLNLFVPRADYDAVKKRAEVAETALATNARQAREQEIEREVAAAIKAGKITPATKDFYIATCAAEGGLEKFREFVQAAPVIVPEDQRAAQPSAADGGALTAEQVALCKRLGIAEKDFAASRKALAV
ncbi:MAG: phage protease [Sinobacteraceae bacterium]|nr:phage protease [Nevskiaceae bacterium]